MCFICICCTICLIKFLLPPHNSDDRCNMWCTVDNSELPYPWIMSLNDEILHYMRYIIYIVYTYTLYTCLVLYVCIHAYIVVHIDIHSIIYGNTRILHNI